MRELKVFPFALLCWVAAFYMIIVGIHDWRLWVLLSLLFAERLSVQLALWYATTILQRLSGVGEEVKSLLEQELTRHGRT